MTNGSCARRRPASGSTCRSARSSRKSSACSGSQIEKEDAHVAPAANIRMAGRLTDGPTRIEHDLLGELAVPADAYYGVHTVRAVENFAISDTTIAIYPDLIAALACIKQAAALANRELGLLDAERASAIVRACEEIRAGKLHDQFVVD